MRTDCKSMCNTYDNNRMVRGGIKAFDCGGNISVSEFGSL